MALYPYDTEYIPMRRIKTPLGSIRTEATEPISIGMVKLDDGGQDVSSYYAVCADLNVRRLFDQPTPFLAKEVWPYLPQNSTGSGLDFKHPDVKPYEQIAAELADFLRLADGKPDLLSWCGAQDHLVLSLMWGGAYEGLPENLPHFTSDLAQESRRLGLTRADWPDQTSRQHHALADAHWHAQVWRFLRDKAIELDRV